MPQVSAVMDLPCKGVEPIAVTRLRSYRGNARTHSKQQIRQIADSIRKFGFTNPVLVSDDDEIIAGHGRAKRPNVVPTIAPRSSRHGQRRAYVLADNKLALNAGWDREILAIELQALVDLKFDVEMTGFSLAEIDLVIDELGRTRRIQKDADDAVPSVAHPRRRTKSGDIWLLGRHRLAAVMPGIRDVRPSAAGRRCRYGLHRPALQCADRRSRLWPRPDPPSRVRHGLRRDVERSFTGS